MDVKDFLFACKKIWEYYLSIEVDALAVIEELKKDRNINTYKEEDCKKITLPHLRFFCKCKYKKPIPPWSNKDFLLASLGVANKELSYWRDRNRNEIFWVQVNENHILDL